METMKFYSTTEVSERYKIHNLTVRRMIADGRLKAVKIGRHWRVSLDALKALERDGLPKMGRPPTKQKAAVSTSQQRRRRPQ
jgi:excisionase family DNA binding protein